MSIPTDDRLDVIPLPPVSFDELSKVELVGSNGLILRKTMTEAEVRERFPGITLPKQ